METSNKEWTFQKCIVVDGYKHWAKYIISIADDPHCLCECTALTHHCWIPAVTSPPKQLAKRTATRPLLSRPLPPRPRPVAALAQGNLGNIPCGSATPAENPTTGSATVNAPAYMPHQAGLSLVANIAAQISMPVPPPPPPNIYDGISAC